MLSALKTSLEILSNVFRRSSTNIVLQRWQDKVMFSE